VVCPLLLLLLLLLSQEIEKQLQETEKLAGQLDASANEHFDSAAALPGVEASTAGLSADTAVPAVDVSAASLSVFA
jgi:hypothetical protein